MSDSRFEEHARHQVEALEIKLLQQIARTLGHIQLVVTEILQLQKHKPILVKGKVFIMSKSVVVGSSVLAVIQGFDQNGNPFPLDASYKVAYAASAPSDVSFGAVNPDGSDVVTGVAADPGDSISATIQRPDGVVISADPDVLVVTAPVPVLTSTKVVLQDVPIVAKPAGAHVEQ